MSNALIYVMVSYCWCFHPYFLGLEETGTCLSLLHMRPDTLVFVREFNRSALFRFQLQWCNPHAATLWTAHNSLKGICNKICDPAFQNDGNDDRAEKIGLSSYMPRSLVAPQFGQMFSPMLSERTGFVRCLDDISRRHREYIQSENARSHAPFVPSNCLAFLHPAFCVEPKLDGERFLVHFSRDGIVKMHTRRGNWYR